MSKHWVEPNWPAPKNVNAYTTCRHRGFGAAPYSSFNLATHVGDDPYAVLANRARIAELLKMPSKPVWLQQVHGTNVVPAVKANVGVQADASVAFAKGQVCTVMTADCLPVLFTNLAGTKVAAAHAGWRGLADGVLENTARSMAEPMSHLMAWLGPAISQPAYQVGRSVYEYFCRQDPEARLAFTADGIGKWRCDLYALARQRLLRVGVTKIYGGNYCTLYDGDKFFSYRRDGETGRMASLIWLG